MSALVPFVSTALVGNNTVGLNGSSGSVPVLYRIKLASFTRMESIGSEKVKRTRVGCPSAGLMSAIALMTVGAVVSLMTVRVAFGLVVEQSELLTVTRKTAPLSPG